MIILKEYSQIKRFLEDWLPVCWSMDHLKKTVFTINKNEENQNNVLLAVTEDPTTSVRNIERVTGTAKSTAILFCVRTNSPEPDSGKILNDG